jgi:protein-S-isoprenylcysteine O-methyltransferase Ste14
MMRAPAFVALGNLFFRIRNGLFPLLVPLAFLPGEPMFTSPLGAVLAGFLVSLTGQAIRVATIGLKYIIRGGRNRRIYAEDLVTDGLYAHSRNPMYVGNILIMVGVAVASNSLTTLAIVAPLFLLIYFAITAAEENFLRARFGAPFDAYCAVVPRFLPRFAGLGATIKSMDFKWRRVIVKEYGTPFGWLSFIYVLALWHLWKPAHSFAGHEAMRNLVLIAMLVTMALWATALHLKRSRRLVAD